MLLYTDQQNTNEAADRLPGSSVYVVSAIIRLTHIVPFTSISRHLKVLSVAAQLKLEHYLTEWKFSCAVKDCRSGVLSSSLTGGVYSSEQRVSALLSITQAFRID